MLSDFTTPMGRGAALGLVLAIAAMLAAVTGVHMALGIETLVDYLVSAPVLAFAVVREAGGVVQWLALVGWFAAVGAALGYCLGEGGDGWFTALVLALAVAAGHAA